MNKMQYLNEDRLIESGVMEEDDGFWQILVTILIQSILHYVDGFCFLFFNF